MHKSFRLVKGAMMQQGIEQKYLCELMNRSQKYISERMTGRRGWSLWDMYFLMDLLNIPHDQMHIYFPKEDLREATPWTS